MEPLTAWIKSTHQNITTALTLLRSFVRGASRLLPLTKQLSSTPKIGALTSPPHQKRNFPSLRMKLSLPSSYSPPGNGASTAVAETLRERFLIFRHRAGIAGESRHVSGQSRLVPGESLDVSEETLWAAVGILPCPGEVLRALAAVTPLMGERRSTMPIETCCAHTSGCFFFGPLRPCVGRLLHPSREHLLTFSFVFV